MSTACGANRIPWVIEGRPGQGINVSMLEFSDGLEFPNSSCIAYGRLEVSWIQIIHPLRSKLILDLSQVREKIEFECTFRFNKI